MLNQRNSEPAKDTQVHSGLGDRAASATKWAFASQIAAKLISPLTTMVLARLLTPEAFGVVASVTMVISFADVFSDAGFQKYLVQHKYKSDDDLRQSACVAFWTNLAISVSLWLLIALFNEQLAFAVGNAGLGIVLVVAGGSIPLTALISVQTGIFQRALNFKVLFKSRLLSSLVMMVVSVILAVLEFDYWAMVVGTLAGNCFLCVFLTVKSRWKPRFHYSFKELREMFAFSGWTLLETISIWLVSWAGTFIVANVMTPNQVGLYKTGTQMGTAITGIVTSSVMPVLFSSLSRLSSDRTAFNNVLYKVQSCLAYVLAPLCCCLFIFRDLAIMIILGEQWLDASLYLGLFFLTSSIKIVFNNVCAEAYRSLGKPKYSMLVELLYLLVLVPLLVIASRGGWTCFSIAAGVAQLALTTITLSVSSFAIGLHPARMIKSCVPAFAAATCVSGIVCVARMLIPSSAIADIILIAAYGVLYGLATFLFRPLALVYNSAIGMLRLSGKLSIKRGEAK
ncbi:lipopolysaccharide biosynthesis protein [Eggerthella lenta]|uniref:lipopolysaccharide biosynthesis protein n=1 Tax=Eggerthella lenta TaxID=84112 RepID=UPI00189AFBF5|nr:lipopolysaccharide biosynthesis protein [Eggerthella lenta]MDB1805546.1 lipopolysaccharide biosynthesis protein [Eggerthella lenta]